MKIIGVIPARYASTRFPGKPLADIHGKPMIWWVYQQSKKCKELSEVYVATDSDKIQSVCKKLEIPVIITSDKHFSGTDRVAEVALKTNADLYVNIQGDEPLIKPEAISDVVSTISSDRDYFGTLAVKLTSKSEIVNPHNVKIVFDTNGYAVYASRSPIPSNIKGYKSDVYKHIGIYIYRKGFLIDFAKIKPTTLELGEGIEYLRALENCYKMKVKVTAYDSIGVDTQEDLEKVIGIISLKSTLPPPKFRIFAQIFFSSHTYPKERRCA